MADATLTIKVQSIGVIDAILTASLLSGLVFQSGLALWKNLDDYFEASRHERENGEEERKFLGSLFENDTGEGSVVGGGGEGGRGYWYSDASVASQIRGLRWWWWLFHDVVFVVGLALILVAALALIRSTSMKIHPGKAIKLVRIWLLGNILVVVIVSMSFVSALFTASICGGLDLMLAWSLLYLLVRGICVLVVWKYLKELTRSLPTLISPQSSEA